MSNQTPSRRQPRRAVTKQDKPVIVYFPEEQVAAMDAAARAGDTDRSKWIRQAIRAALLRSGLSA
jgi:metal-responsive CopG/Arc/MetJ family transcriptional regulator